jgi:ABC-type branched-subunit amino acid transport system substrate-binding protein
MRSLVSNNHASRTIRALAASALLLALGSGAAVAQKKNDTGASNTEIKIGNIAPYSGPASSYATIAKTQAAYFKMINEAGGINGRKINFISYDDGYSPPKTVEQVRKLVESDEVFAIFQVIGTPGNTAIQKYLNQKGVPQTFIGSGATKWADPKNFPWSMAWQPNYQSEARIYARYIKQNYPGKTVGILYQNDDFGKDYLTGFHEAFGAEKSKIIVAEVPYEVTAPTVDSQVVQIKGANPDIFINISTPKFAAQAIKKLGEMKWTPVHILTNVSVSIASVMKPAGYENSQGIISAAYLKDPNDPQWKNDKGMNEWRAFMTRWYPEGDQTDAATVFGYGVAQGLVQALRQCGDEMTRANLMKQLSNMDMEIGIYLPGIRVKTTATDWAPLEQLQLMKFKGELWELFGPLMDGGSGSPS